MRRARENHLIQPIALLDDRNSGEVSCPRTQRDPGKNCMTLPVTTVSVASRVCLADEPKGISGAPAGPRENLRVAEGFCHSCQETVGISGSLGSLEA